ALVLLVTAGTRTAPGAFLLDMESDTGWSKALLSLAAAVGLVVFGLSGPVSGALLGRLSVRRITIAALVITAVSMAASSLISEAWQLAIFFGLLSGIGTGLVASILAATVANRWFVQRRGLVLGILGASGSAGQLVFFPALTILATTAGWRFGAVAIGVVCLAVVLPVLLLLRNDPADMGLRPLGGVGPVAAATGPEPGIMRRAVRSSDFWLLAGTFFVCGATSNGLIGQHFIAHAADHGFSPVAASGALAVMGVFNFFGTIGSGWLTDRVDPRRLLLVYYVFRGISLLFVPNIHDTLGITAFAILFGLDYIATVPPTIALAADVFGRRNVGVVYGWIFASHMFGAAIAAFAAGATRDLVGDYGIAFIVAGWMAVAAGVVALSIRRRAGVGVAVAS
ncbi:MAG: sugar phosphate permease, partial [Chloroflexi bacterium]|nr:sugar phosphate permease [Chloroflexota bacterium]